MDLVRFFRAFPNLLTMCTPTGDFHTSASILMIRQNGFPFNYLESRVSLIFIVIFQESFEPLDNYASDATLLIYPINNGG